MKRLYGLIGFPLTHSFSERYFQEKFLNERIETSEYRNFQLESIDEFPGLLKQYPALKGLNVTIPYKETIMSYLDEIDNDAQEIGAVNTIKISWKDGSPMLKGFNTDIDGFKVSLMDVWNERYSNALVLGSGGASKAVLYVLKSMSVDTTIVSRQKTGENFFSYNQIDASVISNNLLIINTTPVGMFPDMNACPEIPYEFLSKNHLLFDLIYNPEETKFLENGKKMGALTKNGYQMLTGQAEKAWSLWNS